MTSHERKDCESASSLQSSDSENGEVAVVAADASSTSFTRRQKIVFVSCLAAQFLSNVCQSLPAPFLPSLNESHNIRSDMTGWIIGLMPLTQLFMGPVIGKMFTRFSIKTILVTGLFVCGGFTVLFGLLEYIPVPDSLDESIDLVYLIPEVFIRILQAIGAAAILIAAMTLLTITFTENTTTILGYSSTAMGLGYMCGPAIGSVLYMIGGFAMVFGGIGTCILAISVVVAYGIPADEGVGAEDVHVSIRSLLTSDIVAALVLTAFIGCLWSSIEPIIEPELRTQFGLTEEVSALTFLLASFTYTVSSPLIGKALDKFSWLKGRHLMVFGFSIQSINYLFMGPSPFFVGMSRPLWLLLLCLAVLGFAVAVVLIPSLGLISFKSSDTEEDTSLAKEKATKGMLSGFWSSSYSFGDFLGPTFSGVMTEHVSFAWTMTCYSLACMFVVLLLMAKEIYQLIVRCCCNRNRGTSEETLPLIAAS